MLEVTVLEDVQTVLLICNSHLVIKSVYLDKKRKNNTLQWQINIAGSSYLTKSSTHTTTTSCQKHGDERCNSTATKVTP